MGPYEARGVKNGPLPAFVDTRGSENRDLAHLGCFGASEVQVGSGGKGNGERVRGPEAQGPRGPVEGVGPPLRGVESNLMEIMCHHSRGK